ncbi:solute carrier family 2, facilitated glucose transporter member 1-like [Haliotis cracherodii]|uniref:solute carrier family 2, facilitated glucose transporter member 1-like n=1 Tax=Haliotis cracherodii TaxID=6455 RepID=UPI0039E74337
MAGEHERKPLLSNDEGGIEYDEYSINKSKRKHGFNSHLALGIAAITLGSSFQFGYNTGVVNSPEQIIQDFYNETYFYRNGEYMKPSMKTLLWSITVAMYAVGGMIGGVSAGFWANRYGRKGALLRNNVIAVIAGGLLGFSKMAKSYEMLIAGRVVSGLNAGINTGIVPMYLSEIAPISLRGLAGTFNQLAITTGVFVSQLLGLEFILGTDTLWPICLALTCGPVVFQLLTLTCCPESPRFLMLAQGDEEGAKEALMWLRKSHDVEDEIEEMNVEKDDEKKQAKFEISHLFLHNELRIPLIISVVLQLTQQFSGINAVIYYSTSIYESAELSERNSQFATLGSAIVNVLMTFVSALIIDRAGRRILLLTGLGGMFVFTVILTVALVFQHQVSWLSYLCIVAVICYIIFFAVGPGSIPWLIVAELFAQGPRSAAVSTAVLVNWMANCVVGLVFPTLQKSIGVYSFVPFAAMLFLSFLFTMFKVPETKGKTIEEITHLFKANIDKLHIKDVNVPSPDMETSGSIQKES